MTKQDWNNFIDSLLRQELEGDFGARMVLSGLSHYLSDYGRDFIGDDLTTWKRVRSVTGKISSGFASNFAEKQATKVH